MNYWLMKSEPQLFGVAHLAAMKGRAAPWTGVRNYQARNYMRDGMAVGDMAFFYHSSCPEPGIAGIMEIASAAHPDPSQFDPADPYYDPRSSRDNPRWQCVDVRLVRPCPLISLARLRQVSAIKEMVLLRPGNRLSITPVTASHWKYICDRLVAAQ